CARYGIATGYLDYW
nr:immunoglobulin heavy chain junction region [Macaca mulatta]